MQGIVHGCVLAILFSVSAPALSQMPVTPRFKTLSDVDGLPSTMVSTVLQDRQGFLWVNTRDGLARYNGKSFRVYRHDPEDPKSLPANTISTIHLDTRGKLWVASAGHGVSRLDGESDGFRRWGKDEFPLGEETVWTIQSMRDGSTWFGTFSAGLVRLDREGNWTHFSTNGNGAHRLPSNEVAALAVDASSTLWVGTGKGLLRWTGSGFESEPLGKSDHARIASLKADSSGLWIGTTDGLLLRRDDGTVQIPAWANALPDPLVFATLLDEYGSRWLTTRKGIFIVDGNRVRPVEAGGLQGFSFGNNLLEDDSGGLWFAQNGTGVLGLPRNWRNFSILRHGSGLSETSSPWVRAFAESRDGSVWLAGFGGGIDRYRASDARIEHVVAPEKTDGCRATSIVERRDGNLWAACHSKLLKIDAKSGEVSAWTDRDTNDAVMPGEQTIKEYDGVLWVIGSQGIQFRNATGEIIGQALIGGPEGLVSTNVGVVEGPNRRMWLYGPDGVFQWVPETARFTVVPGAPKRVTGLNFNASDAVWLVSSGELKKFGWNGNALARSDRGAKGAPSLSSVGSVLVDKDGVVWVTSARGLIRHEESKNWTMVFGPVDGLPAQEFDSLPALMSSDGRVYASTARGIVTFDTTSFDVRSSVPKVAFEVVSVRRDDAIRGFGGNVGPIEVHPGDRDLRVVARVQSLWDSRSQRFRFRLRGYDRDWVDDDEGERVFTRLEPGRYTLEVVAATSEGVWSTPRRLEIVVLPSWWQTAWAQAGFVLSAICTLLAIAALYRARIRTEEATKLLEQRRALAEQASQSKSRFLADLGHEIRTPMTGVLGMAELMRADAADARQRERIEAIQSAGQHLLVLLNDALDLARIEAGRLELQDVAFDLPALIADACALLRPQAEAKGLDFTLHFARDLPRGVRGDPVRLRQILLNLCNNAVKFTAVGGIGIHARAAAGRVQVEVVDTGPGMDAAQLARLFGRFEQADGAHTWARFGGSGLGLAICRELAQAMGGDIEVQSAPGEGSYFRLTLPLMAAVLPDADAQVGLHVREPSLESAHVLVVEDDALVAEVVCELLRNLGHSTRRAAHAMEALTTSVEHRFDLAVVDLDLPGLDGFELTRLLRAQGFDAPILALTARADTEAEALARAVGMAGFMRKPVSGDMLAAAVARHAGRSAAEAETA